jgi:cytochrome c556
MRLLSLVTACACVSLAACGGWKSGQANSAQGNISDDSRPPATANASDQTQKNTMVLLAVPLGRARAVQVMHARHEGMEALGDAAKAIHRGLAGSSPDLPTVRSNAAKIAMLSQKASNWFPAGTGPDVGKTGAKPGIWQNPDDFAAKLRNFQAAARAFNTAASRDDQSALARSFADLGSSCKACHDKYRAEMKH